MVSKVKIKIGGGGPAREKPTVLVKNGYQLVIGVRGGLPFCQPGRLVKS